MGRILRIELRRSPAMLVALLSAVTGAGLLVSYPASFAGRWMQLAVATRLDLLVLLPLALAGGAWLGRRDALHRVDELFASTVRPRWQRVLPTAAAFGLAVVAAYLLVFLVGAAWVAPTARYFPGAAVAVAAVGALSLVAAGWLGMAAGRAVPRLVTAPALAVVGAAVAGMPALLPPSGSVVGTTTRAGSAVLLLTPIHDGNIDDFQTIVARVTVPQALWLAALAVTGLLLLGVVSRRGIALAVLPAVLGAVIAIPLLPAGGYPAAAAVDSAAGELVCDTGTPQVCLTRVHAYLRPDIAGPARQAVTLLAAKLPGAPTRAVESRQLHEWARSGKDPVRAEPQAGTLVFDLATLGITDPAEYAGADFLSFLLVAPWQPGCGADAPDGSTFGAVAVAWLKNQPVDPQGLAEPAERTRAQAAYRALAGLPRAEQGRRMARARDAALGCRGDALLPILAEGTS